MSFTQRMENNNMEGFNANAMKGDPEVEQLIAESMALGSELSDREKAIEIYEKLQMKILSAMGEEKIKLEHQANDIAEKYNITSSMAA